MASIKSVINAAGKISNILFDLSPKSFYSIADFYNFIRKKQNAPMMRKHFTVVPHCQIISNGGSIPQVWNNLFNDSNLAKFAILMQRITLDPFGIQGQSKKISNPYGVYSTQPDGYSGSSGSTVKIEFLQTADPIIQHMILPWYYQCIRTSNYEKQPKKKLTDSIRDNVLDAAGNALTSTANFLGVGQQTAQTGSAWLKKQKGNYNKSLISQSVIPKLTLDIKYYRMDQIAGLQFLMNPTFVYRFTGVYPSLITPAPFQHGGSGGDVPLRSVTFIYNNFICIPNGEYEQNMFGNVRTGFAYKHMSPIQILNALNQTAQGTIGTINAIRNI